MKHNKLTNKQESILTFIKKFIAKNGYPPTVREIATAVNLSSPATVHVHLSNLIEKGFIRRNKKNKRILELLIPNEYEQIITDEINIPLIQNNKKNSNFKILKKEVNKYEEVVAYKMDNNHLKNNGIFKNDILIFATTNKINDKDIVLLKNNDTYFVRNYTINTDNIIGKLIRLYREY